MAITRTQIAKQLLANGGRIGFRVGTEGTGMPEGTGPGGTIGGPSLGASLHGDDKPNRLVKQAKDIQQTLMDEPIKFPDRFADNPTISGFLLRKSKPFFEAGSRRTKDYFLKNVYTGSKNVVDAYNEYMLKRQLGEIDALGNPIKKSGEAENIIPIIPQMTMGGGGELAELEPEEQEPFELARAFRAKGGRIGLFKGAQEDASAGKGAMSPGTDTGGGLRGGNGDQSPKIITPLGGGGGESGNENIVIEKPPVNIVEPKSNIEKFLDIFRSEDDDNNPENVILGTGLAEEAKQNIIENKEATAAGLSEAEAALRAQGVLSIGGRVGLMGGGMPYEGGIMDFESARQMYGLGKLVKKVTRGIKKIAKSPIGKAALLGGGLGLAGIGPLKGLATAKGLGFKNFIANTILGTPLGDITGTRTGGLFNILKENPLMTIGGVSALAGLMTKQTEEDEEDELYRGEGLDFASLRPYGIQRFAEGGKPEPVAKKTMPLLNMGGMEKDYREDGGFVPIGRMEKADDVPARLSKNEFVFTADAVRNAGDGNVDKGAEVMYNMMKNLESGGDVSKESQGLEGARKMFQTSQRLEEVL